MANPMATFRQHQRTLLAIFSVALILVFTVGTYVSQYLDSSRGRSANDVVVQLATGEIREGDLQSMRFARTALIAFMKSVNITAAQKGATPKQYLGVPNQDDEMNLVRTAIMAKKASELGIEISDDAIVDFLQRYSEGTLERGELATILHRATGGRLSQTQFMDAMRRELLALRYADLFQRGMFPATPAATWDYFQRLNRRVSFEAVPFEAADYLNRVEEPTDAQVQALFDQGKNRFPLPSQPEAGFKRLKKVSVQYVRGDLEDFLAAAKTSVTDEQIRAYYEANRETEFKNISLPPSGTSTPPPQTTPASPEAPGATSEPALPESPATSPEVPSTEGTSEAPTQPLQDDPAEEGPKVNSAPEGVATQEAPAGDATGSTETPTETPAEAPAETPAAEAPSETPAETPSADASSDTNASSEPPSSETPATEPSAEPATDSTGDATQEGEPAAEAAADENPLGELPDAPGGNAASATYKSLEEVTEDIRTRLAAPIAREKLEVALGRVRNEMRTYGTKYSTWEIQNETTEADKRPAPPSPPDLRTLAAAEGLTMGEIPLVNQFQLGETDPVTGKPVYEIAFSFDMNLVPFQYHILSPTLRRFDVQSIRGSMLDVEFLYWKTDEQPERVPELTEVRAEVVRAIKLKQAIQLAKDDAAAAAKMLTEKHQRPSDVYRTDANRRVLKVDSITWMTPSVAGVQGPRVSRVPGIQYPGDEFMKTVFGLDVDQAAMVLDHPQDTAYAVFVTNVDVDTSQLRQQFVQTGPTADTVAIAYYENNAAQENWYRQIERDLKLEWKRDPLPGSERN